MWNATGTSSWTPPTGVSSVNYLVVGGGGSGGGVVNTYNSGGGGAGGFLTGTNNSIGTAAIPITVGAGGTAASGAGGNGDNGDNSIFGSLTATGGGRGGQASSGAGQNGGSGGGGAESTGAGGDHTGTPISQGNHGGTANSNAAGGGGGAGANGVNSAGSNAAGSGGDGLSSTITGSTIWYAGGGGGGRRDANINIYGIGGIGGGGNGTYTGVSAQNGIVNTGGGGGGQQHAQESGGAGGSGIIIIRYLTSGTPGPTASFTPTGETSGTSPLYVEFTDTSVTSITTWNWSYQGYGVNTSSGIWSTNQNAIGTFITGNYFISLSVTNASGSDISSQSTWVNVSSPSSNIDFTADRTESATYGFPVIFTNNTMEPITTWNWSFGDGYTSTDMRPTHYYSVAGLYDVSGIFTNSVGANVIVSKMQYINLTSDVDTNVKSWMHMRGVEGNTTFIDLRGNNWIPSNVDISTSIAKFKGGII
jgi:PKD repeat protein